MPGTLASCGCRPIAFRAFSDHHAYRPADLASLAAWAQELDAAAVVCTRKDLVKIDAQRLGEAPLWALRIGLDFLRGRELLEERLSAILGSSLLPLDAPRSGDGRRPSSD